MFKNTVQTDCFNLMPGLVIDYVGQPAVVVDVGRNLDTEVITFDVEIPSGQTIPLSRSWGVGETVTLVGISVNLDLDSIDLFS